MEIQTYLELPLDQMTAMVKSLTQRFHERHYLLILVKKHLTHMYGDDLVSLSKEELKDRLKLCEEVINWLRFSIHSVWVYKERSYKDQF